MVALVQRTQIATPDTTMASSTPLRSAANQQNINCAMKLSATAISYWQRANRHKAPKGVQSPPLTSKGCPDLKQNHPTSFQSQDSGTQKSSLIAK
jgi:hypothetical protein